MLRKILIYIIVIVIGGAVVFGALYYFNNKKTGTETATEGSTGITLRDFFPFGGTKTETPVTPETPASETPTTTPETPDTTAPTTILEQLSNVPIAGAGIATTAMLIEPIAQNVTITVTPTYKLTKDLKLGSVSAEVKEIQKLLNQCQETVIATTGAGSPGKETTTFSKAMEDAVKLFQQKFAADILTPQELTEPTGKIDSYTRTKLNSPFECTKPIEPPKTIQKEVVRYIEQATGHIYETPTDVISIAKITKTTIPRIHDALFASKGDSVVLRYLDNNNVIQTFTGAVPRHTIGLADQTQDFKGTFLPQNISSLSISSDGSRLFYLTPYNDGTAGDVYTFATAKKSSIYSSSFSEWNIDWNSTKLVTFTTKPSAKIPGFAYTFDADTKLFKKLLGNINGLTILLSSEGSQYLYSSSINQGLGIYLYSTKDKSGVALSKTTLPEKCVFGTLSIYCAVPNSIPVGDYPDVWYQGLTSFTDSIWKIDRATNTATLIINPETTGKNIDAINLFTNPNEDHLYFINKKDNTLWRVAL